MKRILTILFLLFTFVGGAFADERKSGNTELKIWGMSHHFSEAPKNRTFNEVNTGIGVRRYFDKWNDVEMFGDVDYIAKNSTGGRAIVFDVGGQYVFFKKNNFDAFFGVIGGVLSYENTWENKIYSSLVVLPMVGVRHKDVTLNIGYIPEVKMNGRSTYSTLVGNLSFKFQ